MAPSSAFAGFATPLALRWTPAQDAHPDYPAHQLVQWQHQHPPAALGVSAIVTFKYTPPRQVYLDPAITNVADWLAHSIERHYANRFPRPAHFIVTHPPTEVLCTADLDAPMTSVLDILLMTARGWPGFVEPFHVQVVYEGEAIVHTRPGSRKRPPPGTAPTHAKKQHLVASYRAMEVDPERNVVDFHAELGRAAVAEGRMTGDPVPAKPPSIRTLFRHKAAAVKRRKVVATAAASGLPPPSAAPLTGARGQRLFSDEVEAGFIDLIIQFQAASQPMHIADVIDMATTVRDAMYPLPPGVAKRPRVCI